MDELHTLKVKRAIRWLGPLSVLGLACFLMWWWDWLAAGLVFTVIFVAVTLFLRPVVGMVLPAGSAVRRSLRWLLLAFVVLTCGLQCINNIWGLLEFETNYPGNSMDVQYSFGNLSAEVDCSNDNMHMAKYHGAPGYYYISLQVGLAALCIAPLMVSLWLDVLARWFSWTYRRHPPGHCQTCGYNLTGNVSGICPEYGTPIAASSGRDRR